MINTDYTSDIGRHKRNVIYSGNRNCCINYPFLMNFHSVCRLIRLLMVGGTAELVTRDLANT